MDELKSFEELVNSDFGEILMKKPFDSYIEGGNIYFYVEFNGVKYFGSGSYCSISGYYWNEKNSLRVQCDFDSFALLECGTNNFVCAW